MENRKNSSFQKRRASQENVDELSFLLALTRDESLGTRGSNSERKEKQDTYEKINKQKTVRKCHKEHVKSPKDLPELQRTTFVTSSGKGVVTEHKLNDQSIIGACSFNYSSDFPALGDTNGKKNNNDETDYCRHSTNILGQGTVNKNEKGSVNCEEPKNSIVNPKLDGSIVNYKTKATKRIPRTERPITVDLVEASESFRMKKLQSKSISKIGKRPLKRRDQPKSYGGNILDSDQPLIHKGKIRLNEKKRVTKIKTVILEKRHSGRDKKSEWKSALDGSKKIKLTVDMVKDTLLLKSCNFILHERKVVPKICCSLSVGGNKGTSEITESETQALSSLASTNNSIHELPEKDHETSPTYLDDNLNIIDSQVMTPKRMIHSKRFAIYCDQWPIKELTDAVTELLMKLDCFQQKTQAYDPVKLYSKRRFNLGLTEVTKYLRLGKIVMVIFATDIEEIDGKGGLLDTINNIRKMASLQKVPYVFANTQKKLRGILKKNARISCIGIRNYEGADFCDSKISSLQRGTSGNNLIFGDLLRVHINFGSILLETKVPSFLSYGVEISLSSTTYTALCSRSSNFVAKD
ncbi:hypothetical protein LSTR_LSTR001921 [Laodelphax striatellus]|uniref:Ribosomal protein eL8/eL30/eS12/Gadd45 domain-containing protein n=1 Tax=Laodelphax striatellus TaxID=195883 RepID=A0A482XHF4_LAOST|nr:hypothetical protein LSTR_LSTR001921 [Laodelphax striatellus]